MKKILIAWFVNALGLWILDNLMSGVMFYDYMTLLFTALMITLLNMTLKPILKILSLPFTILTLGLFSLVINTVVLELAFALSQGSFISGFGTAFIASIILSVVNALFQQD